MRRLNPEERKVVLRDLHLLGDLVLDAGDARHRRDVRPGLRRLLLHDARRLRTDVGDVERRNRSRRV